MKGITLTQPWASLVACGAKVIETRPKQSHYRGALAIHAALGFEGVYGHRADEAIARVCAREPFRSVLLEAGFRQDQDKPIAGDEQGELVAVDRLPRGKIVATAYLTSCAPADQVADLIERGQSPVAREHELEFGDYSPGRWAWLLKDPRWMTSDVRPVDPPIAFRGNQTLFNVPLEVFS